MLVLFETAAGYAIFKLLNEKKLQKSENLFQEFETPEGANRIVKIKHFEKFADMEEATGASTAMFEGKISKKLKKLLKKVVVKEAAEQLAVADAKLGGLIKEKLNISCVCSPQIAELMRCIRSQTDSLITGLPKKELAAMALGLAHSLSRYKLKFSKDKVDTMIVQAVSLLDDLDKELNNYVMRCREWYGWHFPELGKLIPENLVYVKAVKLIGTREKASETDMSDLLPDDVEEKVKEDAERSIGTQISEEDILNISFLCEQVIEMTEYRTQLYEYLKNRMRAIAPNLSDVLGDLVGARLISHAGSLLNLSKMPASTVQILGAEKALFRAIKAKHDTPKYGLIYHAQLIGQCAPKLKGKMSRMLAAKASISCRVDALGDEDAPVAPDFGLKLRAKLENRLKMLEEGVVRRISGTGKSKAKMERYESKSEVRQYKPSGDVTFSKKRKLVEEVGSGDAESPAAGPSRKKIKVEPKEEETETAPSSEKKKRKIKLEPVEEAEETETAPSSEKKKKKKKVK